MVLARKMVSVNSILLCNARKCQHDYVSQRLLTGANSCNAKYVIAWHKYILVITQGRVLSYSYIPVWVWHLCWGQVLISRISYECIWDKLAYTSKGYNQCFLCGWNNQQWFHLSKAFFVQNTAICFAILIYSYRLNNPTGSFSIGNNEPSN